MEKREAKGPLVKALIVRFGAIGDCVMAVPVAVSIRAKYPDAEIWWAAEPPCHEVLDVPGLVQSLELLPRKAARWSAKTWQTRMAAYGRLRKVGFDIGLDLQGHLKTALCLRIAKPKKRIAARGTDALAARLNRKIEPRYEHTVETNMRALAALGDFETQPRWQMPELAEETRRLATLTEKDNLVTISVGGTHADKRYPARQWSEVALELSARGMQIAFVGGPGDDVPAGPGANMVGQLSFRETMALVKASRLHLSNDTATAHVAAAYEVPVVTMFGPTDPHLFRPYTARGKVLQSGSAIQNVLPAAIIEAGMELLAFA